VRAKNDPPNPGQPPHGAPLPNPDPGHAPFDTSRLHPNAKALWTTQGAPYGHGPSGAPYTEQEYAARFHKLGPNGEHWVAWPPNQGALPDTKVDYSDAQQYVHEFGDRIDRFGKPSGFCMAYLGKTEGGTSAPYFYEPRAIHYDSLYENTPTYTLIPGKLPPGWTIRVMDTAPALGQPGRSVSLLFLDDTGTEKSVTDLLTAGVLR
jgi:Tuberculosis necrotizing toxin